MWLREKYFHVFLCFSCNQVNKPFVVVQIFLWTDAVLLENFHSSVNELLNNGFLEIDRSKKEVLRPQFWKQFVLNLMKRKQKQIFNNNYSKLVE